MWSSGALQTVNGFNLNHIATMFAGTGVIFAAVYLLWMAQRVFFGKITNPKNKTLTDLNWREIGLIAPLLFLIVFMGVYPKPFLNASRESVVAIEQRLKGSGAGGTITKLSNDK
jgi:NADH-quinone oxidoreductase subunit M